MPKNNQRVNEKTDKPEDSGIAESIKEKTVAKRGKCSDYC